MTLRTIERKTDVAQTLEEVAKYADATQAVIVLMLNKDGTQRMLSSTMNTQERSFLAAFLNAWIAKWFNLADV